MGPHGFAINSLMITVACMLADTGRTSCGMGDTTASGKIGAAATASPLGLAGATLFGVLFTDVTMHCRVTGISMLGVPEEMETEIVTTAGSGGAIKRAFNPGGAETTPPLFDSQLIAAFGGTSPSSAIGICSPTSILQSLGRMVTAFVCVATVP